MPPSINKSTDQPFNKSRLSLAIVAAVSGIYDVLVGCTLLLARPQLAELFGVVPPVPPIHADLNALFLLAVGIGYWLPLRDPERYRGYLWVMGPLLKGAGAVVFTLDYLIRDSPASFLLFAASDGTLAIATLWALVAISPRQGPGLERPLV